jgi:hypothetical protein
VSRDAGALGPQPVVLFEALAFRDNRPMDPSPGPWTFSEHMYGIAHCLIDRDGRVIGCNLPIENGPLLEQAPAMAQILRELVAGASAEQLRGRAAQALERIGTGRAREPGEDDE